MVKNKFLNLFIFVCLASLLLSCNDDSTIVPNDSKPINIAEVTSVQLVVLKTNPPQLEIVAKGNTSSAGWTKPVLEQFVYITQPPDGIYDFNFRAVAPAEASGSVITPIKVTHRLSPLPKELKGVRIHAANNNVVSMLGEN